MRKTSIVLATTLIAGIASQTPAFAGFGGASPLGQNPELHLTIAERQQIKNLYRTKKIKPFAGNPNQRLGREAIEWQLRHEDRQRAGKQRRKFGFSVNSRNK